MTRSRRALASLAFIAAGTGCAREARNGPAWVGEIGPETLEGRVRVVGNHPFTQGLVEPEAGDAMVVTGPYRSEIRRLAGAQVRVTGRRARGQLPEPTFEATSYEILSVDGDRPRVGHLERDEAGYYLRGPRDERLRVTAVSEELAARAGALVWVVVDERGGVARYGILREPTP